MCPVLTPFRMHERCRSATVRIPLVPILKEGETLAKGSAGRVIMDTIVSAGYFKTMQIPILEGRDFDDRDQPKTQRVIIVNQKMAEMLWPGESAVGKRIFIGADSHDALEVVGVVKTGKYRTLAEDPKPFFYYSMGQLRPRPMAMVVRAECGSALAGRRDSQ